MPKDDLSRIIFSVLLFILFFETKAFASKGHDKTEDDCVNPTFCSISFFYSGCNANSFQTMSSISQQCSISEASQHQEEKMRTRLNEDINTSSSTSLAIVPYDESAILPHEKLNRTFHIADRDFNIQQDWKSGGVAAVVWDAAVVLAEYLSDNENLVNGKNVLELGAGTGLAGMVAASIGANVTVTERAEALPHLKQSVSSNQGEVEWNVDIRVLDWTDKIDAGLWPEFDVVLGADIVYIEDTFSDLLRTIKTMAPNPKTLVLLSCRIRYERDLKFLHMLKKCYDVQEVFYHSKLDIKIFSVFRKPLS